MKPIQPLRHPLCCALAFIALAVLAPPAAAQATARASIASTGIEGDLDSGPAVVSGNGRLTAFASTASTLVPGDGNFASDVFVHDRNTGQTTLVSVDSAGVQGNADSHSPSISSNGRWVAFASVAGNLDPNDMNGQLDVFVRDLVTGVTTMVSVDGSGVQGDLDSTMPSISPDGRYVAFQSYATNLVPSDLNGVQDIFVHDRATGATIRASVDGSGIEGDGESITPSISSNGLFVAFASGSTNLAAGGDTNAAFDVYVHDFGTLQTTIASVSSGGFEGNSDSLNPSISADGSKVAFTSFANQLVPDDTNGAGDVFLRDLFNGTIDRVSVGTGGTQGNATSILGVVSGDGNTVAFRSAASNLVASDTNFSQDVFVRDLLAGTTERVSVSSTGAQANDASNSVSVSADGRFVAFASAATNLVPGDGNFASDVFVRDRARCADGTVNTGAGLVADVLDVNGETRLATVAAFSPIRVTLGAAPAGPFAGIPYALWVWAGPPTRQGNVVGGAATIGCAVNPTPFDSIQIPRAQKCLRGGVGPEFCAGAQAFARSPASAPWSLRKSSGLRSGTVLTLQGAMRDDGSAAASGFSMTNAVVIEVP